jgi:MFS family permease
VNAAPALSNREIFIRTSFTEPALSSASQAGLVNNLNFDRSWGLFPILFTTTRMPVDRIGILIAVYPAVWGIGQIATGAVSDRWGRKNLITAGMLTQGAALALVAIGDSFTSWILASALLGADTAMVWARVRAVRRPHR